jgi:hypothetical protein
MLDRRCNLIGRIGIPNRVKSITEYYVAIKKLNYIKRINYYYKTPPLIPANI